MRTLTCQTWLESVRLIQLPTVLGPAWYARACVGRPCVVSASGEGARDPPPVPRSPNHVVPLAKAVEDEVYNEVKRAWQRFERDVPDREAKQKSQCL